MARQNAIGMPFSFTSNANGMAIRLGPVLIQFRGTFTLPYLSINFCEATWTFPTPFKAAVIPAVFGSLQNNASGATPGSPMIGETFCASTPSNTAATIRVSRQSGQTNFAPGDSVVICCLAIGEAP